MRPEVEETLENPDKPYRVPKVQGLRRISQAKGQNLFYAACVYLRCSSKSVTLLSGFRTGFAARLVLTCRVFLCGYFNFLQDLLQFKGGNF